MIPGLVNRRILRVILIYLRLRVSRTGIFRDGISNTLLSGNPDLPQNERSEKAIQLQLRTPKGSLNTLVSRLYQFIIFFHLLSFRRI